MSLSAGILRLMQPVPSTISQIHDLFTALQSGACLLTVNNRLSQRLQLDFNRWAVSQDLVVWETPQIQPLGSWLARQAEHISDLGIFNLQVLTDLQENQLWADIVAADSIDLFMMKPAAIARQIRQAWQLLRQWQIPYSELQTFDLPETWALVKWCKAFEKQCRQHGWLSQAQLIETVTEAIQNHQLDLPEQMIFAGFEDPNRQHDNLLAALDKEISTLQAFSLPDINHTIELTCCRNLEDELQLAARWARDILLSTTHPVSIAVVVPSMNDSREQVEQLFKNTLHPERHEPPPYSRQSLYNLSLGKPLSDYALVSDALDCLDLLPTEIETKQLGRLLLAPFLFGHQLSSLNLAQRAGLDLVLRKHGRVRWTLDDLLQFFKTRQQKSGTSNNPGQASAQMVDLLIQLQALTRLSGKQTAESWSRHFLALFRLMGWPGARSLDSHEFQQSERFLESLSQFRQLQQTRPYLTLNEAMQALRRSCDDTIFQAQSDTAPVLVCGLLEAADQHFDHLWLTQLDDRHVPIPAAPNPFIPLAMQKAFNIPHSSVERQNRFSRQLLDRLLSGSGQVMLSYSAFEDDRELRPSPLIPRSLKACRSAAVAGHTGSSVEPAVMERYALQSLPGLPDKQPARGGTGILSQQAACAFMSVATFRFNASEPERLTEGVSPLDWGNQVHLLLEKTWRRLENQQKLATLGERQLADLLQQLIDEVMQSWRLSRPDLYQPVFLQLEKQRLLKLILNWLELEKQRPQPFKVVHLEQEKVIELGGLVFTTRADRVDELANGTRLILDYKTGQRSSHQSWLQEVISEPQLPVYSLAEDEHLAGLALAKIHEKQCAFSGLTRHEDMLPKTPAFSLPADLLTEDEPLPEDAWLWLRQHWQDNLNQLAASYRAGSVELNPQNCQFCHYENLCRKHELASPGEAS